MGGGGARHRRPDASPSEDDLIAHCRDQIAGYEVPETVELRSEPLPLAGALEVLTRTLREPCWAGQERGVS